VCEASGCSALKCRHSKVVSRARSRRQVRAISTVAAGILVTSLIGCRSSASPSPEESIARAKACINADPATPYLPVARPDFQECLEKAMKAPAARRFLLDAGNVALAAWSSDVARFVGAALGDRPQPRFGDAVNQFQSSSLVTDASPRMGNFYRQLVIGAFAQSKDRRAMAAEIAGTLRSFVSQGPGKPVESSARWAREQISDGDDDEVNRDLADIVQDGMEELTALSLWADERVRNALLTATPPDLPAAPPPPATPLLEDPPGRLHIPTPDQEPTHSIFFRWYEHEGGRPLRAAAGGLVQVSNIFQRFLR
jgi:hypothetical protein